MTTGHTLMVLFASEYEAPFSGYSLNPPCLSNRQGHPYLAFDTAIQETAQFTAIMPSNYTASGIKVKVHHAATGTTGTLGWIVDFERIGSGITDTDADNFGLATTITAQNVPATQGMLDIVSTNLAVASSYSSIEAGEIFRFRIKRDVANDTCAVDGELHAIELMEL